MASGSHHTGNSGPENEPTHGRVAPHLHPALTDVLDQLEGTPIGLALTKRVRRIPTSKAINRPVDHAAALTAYRWLLDRADGDGIPLTAGGYLEPADVQALAAVLPTMHNQPFATVEETDLYPVFDFSDYLTAVGLFRSDQGSLRLTKDGRNGLADPDVLWRHLADTLILSESDFDRDASAIILTHMATTKVGIDGDEAAATMTALGWTYPDGTPLRFDAIDPILQEHRTALGNIGDRTDGRYSDWELTAAARTLIRDVLFDGSGCASNP